MSYWTVVLLGIIEGITEFLPISSTGHLLLAEHGLGLAVQPSDLFNVVIQSGAVLAVVLVFAERLKQLAFNWSLPANRDYGLKLAVAFLITGIGAFLMKKAGLKLPEDPVPVAWATFLGGIVILILEWSNRGRIGSPSISWTVALAVGGAQLVAAAFPGTSRSGACIMMALALGAARPAATEFSFLIGIPTLLAAGGYEVLSALKKNDTAHEPVGQLLLGIAVAAITAFLAVRWLLRYVQTHTFVPFGWYRIALGGLILLLPAFKR
jgi:undecaprenyl-diphosphatase